MLHSSVEKGMLWPKAMAGVVRLARVPTTLRWLPPVPPSLSKEGTFLVLSPCIAGETTRTISEGKNFARYRRSSSSILLVSGGLARVDKVPTVMVGTSGCFLCGSRSWQRIEGGRFTTRKLVSRGYL